VRIIRSVVFGIGVAFAVPLLTTAESPAMSPAASPAVSPSPSASARSVRTHHYIANLHGARRPHRLGYDVFDTGPSPAQIAALPRGVKALVWLGQKCPTPADDAFRAAVRRLAGNRRVFGYYLSDEPHVADCPSGPAALATRTAYIRSASAGRQRSFVVLEQDDYGAFRPAVTGATLIGIDPYPCSVNGCRYRKITGRVAMARAAGIPLKRIVPVYQAFGQGRTGSSDSYYRMPTARQELRLLRTWAAAVPHPVMDYTYGWGHQSSANPSLVDSPSVQRVLARWFAR
jgi:hypothetical protein